MCSEGSPLPILARYYRDRAEGGFGLIISESAAVDHDSATRQPAAAWIRPSTIGHWRHCVEQVKDAGGQMFLQLWHEGAARADKGEDAWSQYPTVSPSGIVRKGVYSGRAASKEDLASIRSAYVRSARLAQEAGFSGVEIHAAHGYLLDQFLWAQTNVREDDYGGPSLENRVRFPADITAAVREAVGPDFPISVRLSQWKTTDFEASIAGSPAEFGVVLAAFRDAGADMFNISTRRLGQPEWQGSELSLAAWAKRLTGATVLAVGSVGIQGDITDMLTQRDSAPRLLDSLREVSRSFQAGDFDLLAIGRSSIADSRFVTKIRDGRYDEVRPFSLSMLMEHLNSWEVRDELKGR